MIAGGGMHRRAFVGNTASIIAAGACGGATLFEIAAASPCSADDPGCDKSGAVRRDDPFALQPISFAELEEIAQSRFLTTFGEPEVDRRVSRFGWQIQRYLGVIGFNNPALFYFDDGRRLRAIYWHVSTRLPGGMLADGVIGLGVNYMKALLSASANEDAALFGIVAHEMAHAYQYRFDLKRLLVAWQGGRIVASELHADLVAGYIWGQFPIFHDFSLDQHFAAATARAGDNNFSCRNHHGSPEQRSAALVQGFNMRNLSFTWLEQVEAVSRIISG
jgi:hypothetical protein